MPSPDFSLKQQLNYRVCSEDFIIRITLVALGFLIIITEKRKSMMQTFNANVNPRLMGKIHRLFVLDIQTDFNNISPAY